jgi:hypothetical protein
MATVAHGPDADRLIPHRATTTLPVATSVHRQK